MLKENLNAENLNFSIHLLNYIGKSARTFRTIQNLLPILKSNLKVTIKILTFRYFFFVIMEETYSSILMKLESFVFLHEINESDRKISVAQSGEIEID